MLGCLNRSLRSPWPTGRSTFRWKGWFEADGAKPGASSVELHVEAQGYNLDNVFNRWRIHGDVVGLSCGYKRAEGSACGFCREGLRVARIQQRVWHA